MNKLQQILFWLFAILLFGMGYLFNGWAFISSIFVIIAIVVISPPFICYQEHKNPDNWNKNVSLLIVFGCFVLSAVFSPWFTQEPQVNKVSEEAIQTVIVEEVIPPAEETDCNPEIVEKNSETGNNTSAMDSIDELLDFDYPVLENPYANEYNTPKKFSDYAAEKGDYITFKDTEKNEKKVHVTATGEKYHRANCQYLRQSDYEITLKEAMRRGLEPCSVCNP